MEIMAKKPMMPNVMGSMAAVMAADIMLILGFVFLLLGVSKFLNDFVGIEGSGEGIVGIGLMIVSIIVLARSKMRVSINPVPQMPMEQMPQQPIKEAPSGSYR